MNNFKLSEVAKAIKLTEIFPAYEDYLQPARFKVAYGGRGSAKTRTFITILKNNVLYFGWRIVCFREFMKSIADSVYQEFVEEIERCGESEHFKFLKTEIQCIHSGGIIKFDGLHGNQQKVKGYAGFDAAFVEEAENVSDESWKFLIPTFRKEGSEIWVAYNPEDALSPTHKRFVTECMYPEYIEDIKTGKKKRYAVIKKINYTENPRFPEELRIDMELMRENDYELYRHVYLGECVGNSALAIIKPMWIEAAVDAHLKIDFPDGQIVGGFDVSDEGPDFNAATYQKGGLVIHVEEWKDQDPNTAARKVFNDCLRNSVAKLHYDNIGVGAGAKGAIREEQEVLEDNHKLKITDFIGFTANATVENPDDEYNLGKTNKEMFANLKAQAWWLVADRFKNTYDAINGKPYDPEKLISLDSSSIPLKVLNKLMGELSQPRREFINGKFRVEPKDRMKKRGVVSPNIAESLVMAFSPVQFFDISSLG